MPIPSAPMRLSQGIRTDQGKRRIMKRPLIAAGITAAALIMLAAPAWAHHSVLSGSTHCSADAHVVTWSIGDSEPHKSMAVLSAVATLNGDAYAVTGYTSPVPGGGDTTGETVIPGDRTGIVHLTVHAHWEDGFSASTTSVVTLDEQCVPETTTTTVAPTTTTTAPAPTTTTTVAPTTTTLPTTSTTRAGGTTTTTAKLPPAPAPPPSGDIGTPTSGAPQLPFTGSNTGALVVLGALLVFVAAVLLIVVDGPTQLR